MEDKMTEINEETKKFREDFEYTCADARGAIGFSYTEELRALLRSKVVELRKAEKAGAKPVELRIISERYIAAATEIFKTTVSILQMLRTETFRTYENEAFSAVGTSFGTFDIAPEESEKAWDAISYLYEDYSKETPLKLVKYRGCYFPELDHPYCLSSGIITPKSMRKISEFFGIIDRVTEAVPEEYNDLDSLFDWDYEVMKTIDVYWLFNPRDNSYEADMKLTACFDCGTHPWFRPETWYKGLKVVKPTEADTNDAKALLE